MKRSPGEFARAMRFAICHRHELPSVRRLTELGQCARLCQFNAILGTLIAEFKPDVIHSHWAFPIGSGGYLAAKAAGIPLLMTLRGYEHLVSPEFGYGESLNPFYERTLTLALRAASKITVCCSDSITRLRQLGVYQESKVVTLYHAVNPQRFAGTQEEAEAWKQTLGLNGRQVITCIAGMIHGRKGHSTLIEAFNLIAGRCPNVSLLLVGGGPLQPALEQQVSGLGLAGRVIFYGSAHPNDIQHLIRLSAVTVLPTHCEVFGNVVFESLIAGVPVISGNVGAAKDVLPIGPFGATFEPGNAGQLRNRIDDVLNDERRARRQAESGRVFVLEKMSLQQRTDGFLNLYRELTQGRQMRAVFQDA
jgi:glycosyltransferase involved in cell wall biosynthesis